MLFNCRKTIKPLPGTINSKLFEQKNEDKKPLQKIIRENKFPQLIKLSFLRLLFYNFVQKSNNYAFSNVKNCPFRNTPAKKYKS